ncbi:MULTISPECIES: hypothetical protein [unclassified Streptomyces]|uniref:Uncharacterized protein n=1 Tax=Streptomyces sp. NBC_00060 TaxID=2975636 RepID=A0AAU2HD37_9ACTN
MEANLVSMAFAMLNALLRGIGHGWTSSEFEHALGGAALHAVKFGPAQLIKKLGGGKVFTAVIGGSARGPLADDRTSAPCGFLLSSSLVLWVQGL